VEDPYRIVTLRDGSELSCHALMIATGVKVRELDVPGVEPLVGTSIYYGAATSEAVHLKDGKVFVVGSANSAGQGAVFLARFASRVTMLVRGDSLEKSMSRYLIDQIKGTDNISVLVNTQVAAVAGTEHLETITIRNNKSGENETVPADFVFIGAVPHTDLVKGVVELDETGYILTGPDLIHDGRRPKNWRLGRAPSWWRRACPASSLRATCATAWSGGSHRQWVRVPSRSVSCTSISKRSDEVSPQTATWRSIAYERLVGEARRGHHQPGLACPGGGLLPLGTLLGDLPQSPERASAA
jgi:hypothetical protein